MKALFDNATDGPSAGGTEGGRLGERSGTTPGGGTAAAAPAPEWVGAQDAYVIEDNIVAWCPAILDALLADRSTGRNIIWATDSHEGLGDGYASGDEILPGLITGEHTGTIRPRVTKARDVQAKRTKGKAEVFTPSWICNMQNNVVDRAWFGGEWADRGSGSPFNDEADGGRGWVPTQGSIPFADEPGVAGEEGARSWQDYVLANRMEMACGEAPYLTSRYDTTTGDMIDIERRIGLLDRKLRIVEENTQDDDEGWRTWALAAVRSCYGFEYQGDSLLIARENMLWAWADAYRQRLGHAPSVEECLEVADIVSWNVFQMDAFTFCVPGTDDEALLMNWATGQSYPFRLQVGRK